MRRANSTIDRGNPTTSPMSKSNMGESNMGIEKGRRSSPTTGSPLVRKREEGLRGREPLNQDS